MKTKLFTTIILILLLGASSPTRVLKRKKLIGLITYAIIIAPAVITQLNLYREHRDQQEAITNYIRHINEVEGLQRGFVSNLTSICSKALAASALMGESIFFMEFQLKMAQEQLNKEKANPQKVALRSESKKYALNQLAKSLLTAYLGPEQINELVSSVNKDKIMETLENSVFSPLKGNIENAKELAASDNSIKEDVCFGKSYQQNFAEQRKLILSKLEDTAADLESSLNIYNIFGVNISKTRAKVTNLMEKYSPDSIQDYKNKFQNKLLRFLKGAVIALSFATETSLFESKFINTLADLLEKYKTVSETNIKNKYIKPLGTIGTSVRNKVHNTITKNLNAVSFSAASLAVVTTAISAKSIFKVVKGLYEIASPVIKQVTDKAFVLVSFFTQLKEFFSKTQQQEDYFKFRSDSVHSFNRLTSSELTALNSKVLRMSYNALSQYNVVRTSINELLSEKNSPLLRNQKCNPNQQNKGILSCFNLINYSQNYLCPKEILMTKKSDNLKSNLYFSGLKKVDLVVDSYQIWFNYAFSASGQIILGLRIGDGSPYLALNEFKQSVPHNKEFVTVSVLNTYPTKVMVFRIEESRMTTKNKQIFCENAETFKIEHLTGNKSASGLVYPKFYEMKRGNEVILDKVCKFVKKPLKSINSEELDQMKEFVAKRLNSFSRPTGCQSAKQCLNSYYAPLSELVSLKYFDSTNINGQKYNKYSFNFIDLLSITGKGFQIKQIKNENSQIFVEFSIEEESNYIETVFTNYNSGSFHCFKQNIFAKADFKQNKSANLQNGVEKNNYLIDTFIHQNRDSVEDIKQFGSILSLRTEELAKDPFMFHFTFKQKLIKTREVLNKIFEFNRNEKQVEATRNHDFEQCAHSINFKMVRVSGAKRIKFEYGTKDEFGFPQLKVAHALSNENGYDTNLVIMVSYTSEGAKSAQIQDTQLTLSSIYRKLAHAGWYPLDSSASGEKITILSGSSGDFKTGVKELLGIINKGEMTIHVFLKPNYSDVDKDICNDVTIR